VAAVPDAAGDDPASAVAALYRCHYVRLVKMTRLLVDEAGLGEEIVQDSFAALYERWGRLKDPSAALSYLQVTVLNHARGRLRRLRIARRHATQIEGVEYPPEAGLGSGEVQAIRLALRSLPPRQREAVVLRYYADLPDAEIARSMGISPGAVKSHLHRGMASLARSLEALR
jgi:RNA polymerase sigma-70 factor (sigma-E family)